MSMNRQSSPIINAFDFEGEYIYETLPTDKAGKVDWTAGKALVRLEGVTPDGSRVVLPCQFDKEMYESLGDIAKHDWITVYGYFTETTRKTQSEHIRRNLNFVVKGISDIRREKDIAF